MEPHVVDMRARKKPMHLVASSEGLDLDHARLRLGLTRTTD
jgi:hypothetical protein